MSSRPTFDYNGYPVRAAGVLIWTRKNGRTLRLLRKVNHKFEDIGGKTDVNDNNELDTAIREACEETNGKIFSESHSRKVCAQYLYNHIMRSMDIQYNPASKYLLFKVFVDPTILNLNMKRFGLTEKTEWGVLQHYYQWRYDVPRNLHIRIQGLRL
tara:strand:+ start:405 stop:872 length:468 start_codon:yes stop_codon:yes gene_type:complete